MNCKPALTSPASRAVSPFLALALLLPSPPLAAQDPTPIEFGVPKDIHFFVHGRTPQNPNPGMVKLERALGRLVDSGIHKDVIELATLDMPAAQRRKVFATIDHVTGLLTRVDWGLLAEREVVFAYRFAMPLPEYLVLFRVPEDRVGAQVAGAAEMLEGFAEMIGPAASVQNVERRNGKMSVFSVDEVPVQLAVGAVGDVMVMGTSSGLTAAAMRLLKAGDGSGSVVQTDRYQASIQKLPGDAEETVFVDLRGIFELMAGMTQIAATQIPDRPETQGMRTGMALFSAIMDELSVFDHMVATTAIDGRTMESRMRLQMRSGSSQSALAPLWARQEPWSDWHKMVPADATSFGFDQGVDPTALFDLIVDVLGDYTDQLATPLGHVREILSHVSGEVAFVSFAQAGPTGCALGDSVCLMRLEKTDGVDDWVRAHLDACAGFLGSRGQAMTVETVDGMHEIRLEAFPWVRPVIGVRYDNLILATSRAALAKVGRVRGGQEPNIRSNERFTQLGVGAEDEVAYLQYAQVDESTEDLANLVGAAGFFLSLLPDDRDTGPAIKLGAVLTKLAPVLRDLGMSYDWASEAVTSDPDAIGMRTVYRQR